MCASPSAPLREAGISGAFALRPMPKRSQGNHRARIDKSSARPPPCRAMAGPSASSIFGVRKEVEWFIFGTIRGDGISTAPVTTSGSVRRNSGKSGNSFARTCSAKRTQSFPSRSGRRMVVAPSKVTIEPASSITTAASARAQSRPQFSKPTATNSARSLERSGDAPVSRTVAAFASAAVKPIATTKGSVRFTAFGERAHCAQRRREVP